MVIERGGEEEGEGEPPDGRPDEFDTLVAEFPVTITSVSAERGRQHSL